MGCQFDEEELIWFEEQHCMKCGFLCIAGFCVTCTSEALGASNRATVIIITRDEQGNFIDTERFWIH